MPVLTDAHRFLLERSHANKFLSHEKRWLGCGYVEYVYEQLHNEWGPFGSIKEECCDEGCSVEEYNETGNVRTSCYIIIIKCQSIKYCHWFKQRAL